MGGVRWGQPRWEHRSGWDSTTAELGGVQAFTHPQHHPLVPTRARTRGHQAVWVLGAGRRVVPAAGQSVHAGELRAAWVYGQREKFLLLEAEVKGRQK